MFLIIFVLAPNCYHVWFIGLNEASEHINEFSIGYMINPTLHVNKYFKKQVEKCMNNTFGSLTQPFILKIMTKNNTSVLALLIFYETIKKSEKYFRALSCVIYTIIDNFHALII